MNTKNEHLENLSEIRSLMERSSRFISLSGLSGVFAGIMALAGALFAFFYLEYDMRYFDESAYFMSTDKIFSNNIFLVLCADAAIVLVTSIIFSIFFTTRKAKKQGLKVWNRQSIQLLINLFIPLTAAGIFCILLLYHGLIFLIAPCTLIFYGLSLLNASKYTLVELKWLGITEMIIGLISMALPGYGLIGWAVGFGIMHILYGTVMYYKYEK